jgi:hypothetical protein
VQPAARWGALGAAAKQWLAEREAALLPMPYHHVFTLPARSPTSPQNKAVAYDLLFKAAADTCGRMAKLSY